MKMKTRNILIIVLSITGMFALALVDITSNGKLTTGFLGMALLLLGATIYPSALDLVKGRRKKQQTEDKL